MSSLGRDVTDSVVGVAKPRPMSDSVLLQHSQSYVRPELMNWPIKCAYVVDEILTTESAYLTALEDIIEGYKNPLSGKLKMTNEDQRIIRKIFSNVEELRSLHSRLLEQLRDWEGDPHEFGRVFSDSKEKFRVYSEYCTNYDSALETLDQLLKQSKDIESFVLSCQRRLGHPLPLTSQLIKPVQRIMRYHLLLNELVKKFDPNVTAYTSLSRAHRVMSGIAEHVNEVKKRKENAERALDIQNCLTGWSSNLSAYGHLIYESPCRVGKRGAERQLILFEKLLLILKKKDVKRYNYKAHILADELCIDKDPTSKPSLTFKVFSKSHSSQTYVILTDNIKVQSQWVREINHLLKLKKQEEAEREKLMKQRVSNASRQTIHDQPHYRYASSHTRQMLGSRKRQRTDIRSVFPEEEGSNVELTSVKPLQRSHTHSTSHTHLPDVNTTDAPLPESSIKYAKVATDQSDLENDDHSQRVMKTSKSSDSVVSLSDVELGVEGVGGVEEVDSLSPLNSPTGTPIRKPSALSRKAAIKVKKTNVTPSSSYQNIIRMRAQEARRSANRDQDMEREQYSDEEESDLSQIISSPQTSIQQAQSPTRETTGSLPMEYDSVYQSGGLEAGGPPPLPSPAANGEYQIEIGNVSPTEASGDPESGRVYDSGLGELEGSVAQEGELEGEFPSFQEGHVHENGEGVIDVEGVEDFVILEDSSDSEDEDSFEELPSPLEEGGFVPMEAYLEGVIPPPGQFVSENGDQELSQVSPEEPINQLLSTGELTNFFQSLRNGETPSSHDQSGDNHEEGAGVPGVVDTASDVYQFTSQQSETIYATLPRKSHSKSGSPMPRNQPTTPPGPHLSNSQFSQSSQTLSRSAARRAEGFSRLLEFTRLQKEGSPSRKTSAPMGYSVTQSLAVASLMGSRSASSLGDIHEGREEREMDETGEGDVVSEGREDGDVSEGREDGDASEGREGREDGDASEGREDGDASEGREDGDASEGREDGDVSEGRDAVTISDSHPQSDARVEKNYIETEMEIVEPQADVIEQSHNLETVPIEQSHDLETVPIEQSHDLETVPTEQSHDLETVPTEPSHALETVILEQSHDLETVPTEQSHDLETVLTEQSHDLKTVPTKQSHDLETVPTEPSHDLETVTTEQSHDLETVTTEQSHDPNAIPPPTTMYGTTTENSKSELEQTAVTGPEPVPIRDTPQVPPAQTATPLSNGYPVTTDSTQVSGQPSHEPPLLESSRLLSEVVMETTQPQPAVTSGETGPQVGDGEVKSQPQGLTEAGEVPTLNPLLNPQSVTSSTHVYSPNMGDQKVKTGIAPADHGVKVDVHQMVKVNTDPDDQEVKTDIDPDDQGVKTDSDPDDQGVKTDTDPDDQGVKTDTDPDDQGVKTDTDPDDQGVKTDTDPGDQGITTLPMVEPITMNSDLRKRPVVTQSPSSIEQLPKQEAPPTNITATVETTPTAITASVQPVGQRTNVLWRLSRMIRGLFPQWTIRNGLILLGVLAVSASVLVYGLWG